MSGPLLLIMTPGAAFAAVLLVCLWIAGRRRGRTLLLAAAYSLLFPVWGLALRLAVEWIWGSAADVGAITALIASIITAGALYVFTRTPWTPSLALIAGAVSSGMATSDPLSPDYTAMVWWALVMVPGLLIWAVAAWIRRRRRRNAASPG
ncbi:MAG: hypothetical protein EA376_07165 [Phycisphaeraceae bacterium]|nr:MAG: hypothetical protein EA376_07165 [Phycisphaeraceae bacterium]